MRNHHAYISEIFSSIQGEGVYVGVRQVFVRFAGCNLSCDYCDTPASGFDHPESCAVQIAPGERRFKELPNPLDVPTTLAAIINIELESPGHHSVSLTGGEPLMQAPFLAELCPELRKSDLRAYLESNGTLVDALSDALPHIDIVAMDFKLESATGIKPATEMHREFLAAAVAAGKDVFVKAIVTSSTAEEEIEECAAVIALAGRRIPLIIQPVTSTNANVQSPFAAQIMRLQVAASRILDDVRVIPQCHKMLGLI
ncbi:MAG: 7-carboxy-7-deazaguanine synthase QueE [Armatimonadota bacterium]|nr:7-carboxy-7-deazaguanine synthase QueE [Armatimonadota bacterium]